MKLRQILCIFCIDVGIASLYLKMLIEHFALPFKVFKVIKQQTIIDFSLCHFHNLNINR